MNEWYVYMCVQTKPKFGLMERKGKEEKKNIWSIGATILLTIIYTIYTLVSLRTVFDMDDDSG